MTDKRIIAEIERRIEEQTKLCKFMIRTAELSALLDWIVALPPDDLAVELEDARDALKYSESKRQFEMRRAVEETKIALDYCGLEAELAAAKAERELLVAVAEAAGVFEYFLSKSKRAPGRLQRTLTAWRER